MLTYLQYPYGVLVLIVLALLFWRPVWGLVLLAAIFPMDLWAPRLPVPGMNTETIMIGVAFAVTVLRFGARIPPLRYSGPAIALIATMLIAFAVSITWARGLQAIDGGPAIWFIFKAVKSMTFTALLFIIVYWWFSEAADRQRMLVALCVALFLSSFAGIVDYIWHINPMVTDGRERANGFIADANGMAESIGPLMFVPLYMLMRGREIGRGLRAFAAVTYGLAAVAMVLSLSRGNWIAFIVAHGVFLLLVNRKLFVLAFATAALLVTAGYPFLPEIVRERIEITTTTGGTVYQVASAGNLDHSTGARVVFARIGYDMFMRSPIWGNGLDSFVFHTPEYGAKYGVLIHRDPHNLMVMLAAETGLIGLSTIAWLIWAVFRCGRLLWRSDSSEYLLGAVMLAAATHDLVANLGSTTFLHLSQISAQFWILYAISARACVERYAEQEAPVDRPVRAARWRRFADRSPVPVRQ